MTSPLVLSFDGGVARHVNHGPFWPVGVNLGRFFWDAWLAPANNAGANYYISDGSGGSHALLAGFQPTGSNQIVTGNLWDGSTLTTFGSDDSVGQGEWAHHAIGWDGTYVVYWLDGIVSGLKAFAGPRRAGLGQLYVGGSDHQNFVGSIAQIRGFEDSFPFLNLAAALPGFTPERFFSAVDGSSGQKRASFLADYMLGGGLIPDLSDGYHGVRHPGSLSAGPDLAGVIAISTGAVGGVPQVAGRPDWIVDASAPFDPAVLNTPTGVIAAVPSTPAGAKIFDSFNRAKQSRLLTAPTLGQTQAGSLGPLTWSYGLTGDARTSKWGILNGRAVCLFAQGAARETAWVTNDTADMDVRVDRRSGATYGTHDTGLTLHQADNLNHYAVVTRGDPILATTVDVWKNIAGTVTNLGTFTAPTTAWTTLRATFVGTTLTVYCDNGGGGWTQIGQLTGQTQLSTAMGAGLANYNLSQVARHDNFTVL
ncbi:MAG: LamG domain-containing protein [Actinomycetota bacterium]|nr:LamG domain-containing protein [Actinomycetota bacterium]